MPGSRWASRAASRSPPDRSAARLAGLLLRPGPRRARRRRARLADRGSVAPRARATDRRRPARPGSASCAGCSPAAHAPLLMLGGALLAYASASSQHGITWLVQERGFSYPRAAGLSALVTARRGSSATSGSARSPTVRAAATWPAGRSPSPPSGRSRSPRPRPSTRCPRVGPLPPLLVPRAGMAPRLVRPAARRRARGLPGAAARHLRRPRAPRHQPARRRDRTVADGADRRPRSLTPASGERRRGRRRPRARGWRRPAPAPARSATLGRPHRRPRRLAC